MRIGSGLFLLGILTLMQFRDLPATLPVGILTLVLVVLSSRYHLLRYLACYLCGFLWCLFISDALLSKQLPVSLEGTSVHVLGHVSSLPTVSDHYLQFDFELIRLYDSKGRLRHGPKKIRLNWYKPFPDLSAGQALALEVRLKRPHGYMNPNGFDAEAWLFQQRIRASGYVRKNISDQYQLEDRFSIHSIRQSVREKLDQHLDSGAGTALVLALAIGDQTRIVASQWQTLAATGTGHLMSISGLHIGLVAAFAFFMTRWLWPIWPRVVYWIAVPRMACLTALLASLLYAILAGFSIPVQRSLIMISVFILPGITNRQSATADSYAIALLAVLVIDPLAVLSMSFWLSFGAVLVILLIPRTITPGNKNTVVRKWLKMQIYIFTGLLSILAVSFNQIPITTLLANTIAIPWVSFVSVPLILGGVALLYLYEPVGSLALAASIKSLDFLWPILDYLAGLDQMLLTVPEVTLYVLGTTLIGTALLFMPAGMPGRWLGLFWLMPLFFPRTELPDTGEFEAVILDVGQGLAVILRTRQHLLLYDTGPGFSSGFNTGRAVILPYLKSTGHQKIALIVQSHADTDHIGGLPDILDNIRVEAVLTSVPDKVDFTTVTSCVAGQRWSWDGVTFEILSPDASDRLSGNNASCVLKADNGQHSILIPGDIERQAEILLLNRQDLSLRSTVLVIPHHGSSTSSTPGFIRSVAPEYAIVSAGFLNRFRLPKQDIMATYIQSGITTLNTADSGAISIQFSDNGVSIMTERERSSRFWNFSL